jgi:diguanylate cyclase
VSRLVQLIRSDRSVAVALVTAAAAITWFALGPTAGQRFGIRLAAPIFATLLAVGQWRVGGQPHQSAAAARFWRILSLGMFTYTGGMLVNLVTLTFGLAWRDIGETVFYPVAGLFTIVALVAFPTARQSPVERVRLALDVATVVLACASFVWYFLVGRRWQPGDGWEELSDGLVLPALTLVAGFVIVRITVAGIGIISRPTMVCFVFGAMSAAVPIIVGAPPDTPLGRVGSTIHVAGMMVCVVGVALQYRAGPTASEVEVEAGPAWRRPFSALPYGAMAATLALLLIVVGADLDYRGWVVVLAVLALCGTVVARQFTSLWENSRLLAANRELTGRLRHQAFHDHLTGLANRLLFTERVTDALAAARRDGSGAAVLFVDLDDFKIVNDSLGHQIGDELLHAAAGRLRETIDGPADGVEATCLGRLGGDEFAILVTAGPGRAGPAAEALADRVIDALGRPFQVAGLPVTVNASVGIAVAAGGQTAAELLRNADVAMYSAKNRHKGGWQVFEPAMLRSMLRRHRLRAGLADALAGADFVVHYQPIVDLVDGTVHGAEALVRWLRPDGRLVPPSQFIPLAEETGLVTEIDRWVLGEACRQAGRWRVGAALGRPFTLHVNLSARHLHRSELVSDVGRALADGQLPAACLTLEITESGLGHDHEAAIERLGELGGIGVHLAIDDFGTGYSSLAYLRRMPVDVLKIDKTFTDELTGPVGPAPLAQAVIALATALGMQTVAEGIEEPVQASRLVALGCRYGQGFHYAQPLPPEQLEQLLGRATVGSTAVG